MRNYDDEDSDYGPEVEELQTTSASNAILTGDIIKELPVLPSDSANGALVDSITIDD